MKGQRTEKNIAKKVKGEFLKNDNVMRFNELSFECVHHHNITKLCWTLSIFFNNFHLSLNIIHVQTFVFYPLTLRGD